MQNMKLYNKIGDLSGKGRKACHRLESLDNEVTEMIFGLSFVREKLYVIALDKKCETKDPTRSIVLKETPRIEFSFIGIDFYIDFTISVSEKNGSLEINGDIIYGTMRTQCYANCADFEKQYRGKKEICERVSRCDGLDDKPILKFSLNRHGMIKSTDLKDEWWIKKTEEEKDEGTKNVAAKNDILPVKEESNNKDKPENILKDMHIRALNSIWKESLDWNNEIIMP